MIATLLLAAALQAQQPVRVQASLSDAEIRAGQTTTLRVDVETDGARAQIQRFETLPPGLELTGTRDWDQRQFTLPGGTRRHVSREFVLRGIEPGQYRIPAVDVLVDGRAYSTQSLLLTVGGSGMGPDGLPAQGDGVILRAWLDADTVYVGQQVTLHAEAMFSPDARLRLRRAPEYEAPSPSGFWLQDIPGPRPPTSRGTRGDVYEIQTFRRAFFPITPGRFEIPPARLFYEMRRGILSAPETFTVASDPLPLVVLPVPEAGRPPEFTGAVGRFTARGGLEPARVAAGEAAILSVEVGGVGNVKALPPPRLPEFPGVQVFPPSEESDIELDGTVVQGRKRFSWVIIPHHVGDRTLPEIQYVFFDPATARFDTATIAAAQLAVGPGAPSADRPPPATALRYLKTAPAAGPRLHWVRSPWFAATQLVPLLLLAGVLMSRGRGRGDARVSFHALRRRRRAAFRDLEDRARTGAGGVAAEAESEARAWLAARLALGARSATDPDALALAGVAPETAATVCRVLDRLAAARYEPTPPRPDALRELIRGLAAVLERVDREAPKPHTTARRDRERSVAAAAVAVAAIGIAAIAGRAAPVQAGGSIEDDGFTLGLTLFDDSRYEDAANAFERHIEAAPNDAAGWYNLGTSRYRAGQPGHAVWAWLNAARLDPRDPDPRHNLRLAGAAPELVMRVTPRLPLHVNELLLLASILWFVAGGAATSRLIRRAPPLSVAGVSAVLAVGLVVSAWTATRTPETLVMVQPAPLRAGPSLNAETLVGLDPGTGLVPVARQGPWVRARTFEGREGWLEDAVIARIPAP